MNKISYGLYALTSRCGNQFNGCIINTLAQVTTSQNAPMTYFCYHANVKPKPAAAAPKGGNVGERWVCNICGYIYEGALPADFVCPVCKHGAADFTQIDKDGNAVDGKPQLGTTTMRARSLGMHGVWICVRGCAARGISCTKCKAGAEKFAWKE